MSQSPTRYDAKTVAEIRDWVRGCTSLNDAVTVIVAKLDLNRDHVYRLQRQYGFWSPDGTETQKAAPREEEADDTVPASKGAHMSYKGDTGEVDLISESPRTLEEMLKACHVDLNVWEVEKYVINKWEMGRKAKTVNLTWVDGVASGSVEDTGGITKAPLWQVKAWLRRKVESTTLNKLLENFVEKASQHAPRKWVFEKPKPGKADCCYVLNGHDLHLAKLAWGPETGGADWDIKIAREKDDAAVEDLMSKVPVDRVEQVVVIVGSDMLQVDNNKSSTTAGTYVDSDSRLPKAYDFACDMLTTRIEKLAARFKVKVVVIPGNHDSTVSYFLGRYVKAWFREHPNVEVDAAPLSRKYHGYGKTLIAFDHGDETKIKELAFTVMRENQSTISQYRFTECLTGHLHHEQSEDFKGIIVRVAPALCSPDKWHAQKGYIGSIRRSQGLLYQRENGLEAIYYSNALD